MRAWVAAVLAVTTWCATARADKGDFKIESDWWKLGLSTGGVFARDRGDATFTIGAVATRVHLREDFRWYGARFQLVADTNGSAPTAARWLVGAEAGVGMGYGAIVSYTGEHYTGRTDHGVAVHAKLTTGLVAVYTGVIAMVTSPDVYGIDVGLELKIPVWSGY